MMTYGQAVGIGLLALGSWAVILIGARIMSTATDRLTASANALAATVSKAIPLVGSTTTPPADDSGVLNGVSDLLDTANARLTAALPAAPSA